MIKTIHGAVDLSLFIVRQKHRPCNCQINMVTMCIILLDSQAQNMRIETAYNNSNTSIPSLISLTHQTSLSVATDCNRLQPIGMLGVSPNFGANGSNTSNTSVLLASRRENAYRL